MGYSLLNYLSLITISISGFSILVGLFFIKKGKREIHKFFMINASIFALVFVLLYVLKSILYPPQPYTGPYRGLFLFILWTHTLLAIVNFPIAVITIMQWLNKNA